MEISITLPRKILAVDTLNETATFTMSADANYTVFTVPAGQIWNVKHFSASTDDVGNARVAAICIRNIRLGADQYSCFAPTEHLSGTTPYWNWTIGSGVMLLPETIIKARADWDAGSVPGDLWILGERIYIQE